MKPALVTLFPMFAAAGLVLFGGERLARREHENRATADRERLVDFAEAFGREIDRLEQRYRDHLDGLADAYIRSQPAPEQQAREIAGVASAHLFTSSFSPTVTPRKDEFSVARPGPGNPRLPEVELDGGKNPLDPQLAVILPRDLLDDTPAGSHGWIEAPEGTYRVYWRRPDAARLVALVIIIPEVRAVTDHHLQSWMPERTAPLLESGELVAVQGAAGETLLASGTERRGPAVLVMPFRNSLGAWQIQAWDRVTVATRHDPATLAVAGTLAAILALSGILLCLQQRRAMRLAEERVSFVNRVSHELGSPLTNLALNVDLAVAALDANAPEARRRLGVVTEEIERLCRLVANVLTFSRRERQTLEMHPQACAPDEIIDQILGSSRPALERRGIQIERRAAVDRRIRLDPAALGQIVGNLVSNVEKYASAGRLLRLDSRFDGESLVVQVSDEGPGVPESSRQRIFEPFERARESVNEGSSGTGLGLAISHDLAHRMGGSLTLLDSRSGATFELRLPAPMALAVVDDGDCSAA
jgi:signal transduction histidine kinase